eukprot:4851760-Prorocentrum_lima.AAC.1
MPIDESDEVLIEAPQILSRLELVKTGTFWKTRRNIYGNQKGSRIRQEERDQVLEDLTWYSDHWKSKMYL